MSEKKQTKKKVKEVVVEHKVTEGALTPKKKLLNAINSIIVNKRPVNKSFVERTFIDYPPIALTKDTCEQALLTTMLHSLSKLMCKDFRYDMFLTLSHLETMIRASNEVEMRFIEIKPSNIQMLAKGLILANLLICVHNLILFGESKSCRLNTAYLTKTSSLMIYLTGDEDLLDLCENFSAFYTNL